MPSMTPINDQNPEQRLQSEDLLHDENHTTSTRPYSICYLLIYASTGAWMSFASALFTQIQHQLNITELQTSYIMLCRNIGYITSCLLTAPFVDKFENTHKVFSLVVFTGGMACAAIPFIRDYGTQCVLWTVNGISIGTAQAIMPVFVFRKWRENPSTILISFWVTSSMGQAVGPLLIELSIRIFHDYCWSMILLAMGPVIGTIMLWTLPTPRHDTLRSIQTQMNAMRPMTHSTRIIKDVEADLKAHQTLKIVTESLVVSCGLIWALLYSGPLIHITAYCEEYLGVSAGIGRLLYSVYGGGITLMRLFKASARGKWERYLNTARITWIYLWTAQIVVMILFGLWILVPFKSKVPILFVVVGLVGFIMGDFGSSLYRLIEAITPLSGRHTAGILTMFTAGETLVLLVNGAIMEKHSVKWYPYVLLIGSVIGIPILLLSNSMHRRYCGIQKAVMSDCAGEELENKATVVIEDVAVNQ